MPYFITTSDTFGSFLFFKHSLDSNEVKSSATENGRTRDIVAKEVGISSGKQYEQSKKVVAEIDKLKSEGKNEDAILLSKALEKAPSAAYELVKIGLDNIIQDSKDDLMAEKTTVNAIIKQKKRCIKNADITDSPSQIEKIPNIIDIDYVEVSDTATNITTTIVDSLKKQAEDEYIAYRGMLEQAETKEEREDIIAKRQGLSGRSEYLKIMRMAELCDILKSKGVNYNYINDYLEVKNNRNKISILLATYVKAKTDVGEKIDPINISADENIIEDTTLELEYLTTQYHKSISSFTHMNGLIENMDISKLKIIRQRMEWTLDTMDNFFNKVNEVIGDGCSSPLSVKPLLEAVASVHNTVEEEPVVEKVKLEQEHDTKIIEIDPPEYREKMLLDNKEQLPLSKIFHLFKSDIPRYHFYKELERELGLCDKDGKLLIPYVAYEMYMLKYKSEEHDTIATKINENTQNNAFYNKVKI